MTQAAPFEIRRARREDMPDIEAFYRIHFSDRPRLNNVALWRWEFIEHPLITGDLPFFLIESGGEIQGTIGYQPLQLRIGEQTLKGGYPVNFFVTPKFRGLPALRLLKAALNECPIVFAGYISDDSKRLFRKMGFVDLSQHVRGYYFSLRFDATRAISTPRRFLSKMCYRLRTAWGGLLTLYFDRFWITGVRHEIANDLHKDFENFITNKPEQMLSVYKDNTYLRWRYSRSPALNCLFIHQYHRNRPSGLAVVHIDSRQNQAIILDIIIHPFTLSRSIHLLAAVVSECRKHRLSMLTLDILNAQIEKALRIFGFGSVSSQTGLTAYAADKNILALLSDYRNWHFIIGDTDKY